MRPTPENLPARILTEYRDRIRVRASSVERRIRTAALERTSAATALADWKKEFDEDFANIVASAAYGQQLPASFAAYDEDAVFDALKEMWLGSLDDSHPG